MSNHLSNQTSPYLLQHSENPVNWYPWCDEAFEIAKDQDKPIFLSIGYSTCHWCHVMAHESFEDKEIADILNRDFVCIKVDKEERPDIDSVYMAVCQAFTGSGGWPMSIFMTPDRKPFFAGTYFPKSAHYGTTGLKEILLAVNDRWKNNREALIHSANNIISALNNTDNSPINAEESLLSRAVLLFEQSFDNQYGGFGNAPKFPTPHNLMFLMQQYVKNKDNKALQMAEKTLVQMYRGGIFDHIEYGFCRYSTDRYYLIPHFEKMLYDNAFLIQAYAKAYEITKKPLYLDIAEKTAHYVLTEMQSKSGGFYSAQDADSDGEEGKYYTFTPQEVNKVLGNRVAKEFNEHYNITERGNFQGKSIPNLLKTDDLSDKFSDCLSKLKAYRKKRTKLNTDDKIITTWNCYMIAGLCSLYRVSQNDKYLMTAKRAMDFINSNLKTDDTLYVSYRNGRKGGNGFLDEYASYIYALLAIYDVTLNDSFIKEASKIADKAIKDFFDNTKGGFYLYGIDNEVLITRPKESYDGANPSGNSLMTYNLVRLNYLLPNRFVEQTLKKQVEFMAGVANDYPAGYSMYLIALSDYLNPSTLITAVKGQDSISDIPFYTTSNDLIKVLDNEEGTYKLVNGNSTFYLCKDKQCMPPINKSKLFEQSTANWKRQKD